VSGSLAQSVGVAILVSHVANAELKPTHGMPCRANARGPHDPPLTSAATPKQMTSPMTRTPDRACPDQDATSTRKSTSYLLGIPMTDLRICIMQCTCSSGHWLRRTEGAGSLLLIFSDTDGCVTPVRCCQPYWGRTCTDPALLRLMEEQCGRANRTGVIGKDGLGYSCLLHRRASIVRAAVTLTLIPRASALASSLG